VKSDSSHSFQFNEMAHPIPKHGGCQMTVRKTVHTGWKNPVARHARRVTGGGFDPFSGCPLPRSELPTLPNAVCGPRQWRVALLCPRCE